MIIPADVKRPSRFLDVEFCPTCGRDNLRDILRGNHYAGGSKCDGTLVLVRYEVEEPWRA